MAHICFTRCVRMNVLALTILISACLAGIFIVCFFGLARAAKRSSPERDSLLPLDNGND